MDISNNMDPQVVTHTVDPNLATLCASWREQALDGAANLDQLVRLEMQVSTVSLALLQGSPLNETATLVLATLNDRITNLLSVRGLQPL